MNKTLEELLNRKSTRIFADKKISDEDKQLIIDATCAAPSAGNMQLYSIIEVTDKELKDKLAVLCDNQPFISKADWVLIYLADYQKWYDAFLTLGLTPREIQEGDLLLATVDATIAAQNTVTAAESLGINSCYIGDIMENYEEIKKLLNLPRYTYPACMLVLGYPGEGQEKVIKPKRVDNKYILKQNVYTKLNAEELKDMLSYKANNKSYEEYMKAFMERKHNSDFSKEMQRSARLYIKDFSKQKES